ncbi:MAG: hypothetical protein ASARMPRED_003034 [Alectoria sarmentosa]|nr:MAG: hypothetical protein ASARMPRED_003034 [Alectoria sarmentosa]
MGALNPPTSQSSSRNPFLGVVDVLSTMAQRADDAREQEGPCDKRNESYLQELSVAPSRIFSEDRHLDPDDVRHRFRPPVFSQSITDSSPSIAKASVLANRSGKRTSVAGAGEEEGERPVAKNSKTASNDDEPAVGPGDRASAVVVGSIQTLSPSNVSGMRSYRVPLL